MIKKQFIPFSELKDKKAIVVDSTHPNGLILSHWRGTPTPDTLRADTSAAIVLNAIRENIAGLEIPYVTANHFDIDGFVGVWSLLNPELALEHEELLRQVALIGDFRELDLNHPLAGEALKLVCWINARERELYLPTVSFYTLVPSRPGGPVFGYRAADLKLPTLCYGCLRHRNKSKALNPKTVIIPIVPL